MNLKPLLKLRWQVAPPDSTPIQRQNFLNVQVDAIGIGLAGAAAQFLPVFLARLGASNFQVGLLTAMPALTGLFLAISVGRFLQSRRKIVPWFSRARLMVVSAYALTGLVPFIVPEQYAVPVVLAIWALATLPQIIVNVAFSVVMNAVAGPTKRYELMSRRWSILGFTTALTVAIVGETLVRLNFPVNYQIVFLSLSVGGLISYYFSSHIDLPETRSIPTSTGRSFKQQWRSYFKTILAEKPFVSFTSKRFVYLTGQTLAAPIFPLYYVRVVYANDAWIGIINTAATAVLVIGYFLWARQSRKRGSRFVLLCSTLGMAIYPALIASTQNLYAIVLLAGFAGIFQSGIDLVFFDELMKTVPEEYSAVFVSWAQGVQYLSSFAAPLIGTLLANSIGLGGALLVSAAIRLVGFLTFAVGDRIRVPALVNLSEE